MKHDCNKTEDLLRIECKVDDIGKKVDSLLLFRSKLMGGAAVIGTALAFLATWLVKYL